ncbi:MAG: DMT family transporter [Deltaproteobacteria bacterium]|jgi:drug/metabolite transporter (DMT)-like permease|nr:DMT family transporter [Deltaproteobacteria bacterium]
MHSTLLAASAVLLWSTAATAFKLALRGLDPYQLLFIAACTSCATLGVLQARNGGFAFLRELPTRELLRCAIWGLLNPLAYYLLLFQAYARLPAQMALSVNYSWVIMLALLSVPFLGQRLSLRDIAALCVSYGGVLLIATGGELGSLAGATLSGLLFALASTLVWAGYWIAGAKSTLPATATLLLHFAFGLPWAALACVLFSSLPAGLSPIAFLPAVYVGLFEMSVTFLLWMNALRRSASAARTGSLAFFSPFLSLCWIALVLGEAIAPATLLGLCCIIGGTLLQRRAG